MPTRAVQIEQTGGSGRWAWKYAFVGGTLAANMALVILIAYSGWVAQNRSEFQLAANGQPVETIGAEVISKPPADQEGRKPRIPSRPLGNATHTSYPVYFGTDRSRAVPFAGLSLTQSALMLVLLLGSLFGAFLLLVGGRPWWQKLFAIVLLIGTVPAMAFCGRNYLPLRQHLLSDVFGDGRGELQYGICRVAIPHTHTPGFLEGPSLMRFEFRENPDEHLALEHVQLMTTTEFQDEVRSRAAGIAWREALVFIHGYNTSFEDAARRTAQLGYDLNFGGVMALFSWPSVSGELDYSRDVQDAMYAWPHLKEFLELLAKEGELNRIHVIAHSMGNQCLAEAVRMGIDLNGCRFDECILAAPDVDAQIFKRDVANRMSKETGRLSLYASRNDKALQMSKVPNRYPRLGDCDPITVLAGMESIDISRVPTDWLGHSTFAMSPELINDIRQMIDDNLPAASRLGMQVKPVSGTLEYWEFVP